MTRSSPLNSEFNDFLFAPIGDEANEMLLSVLSALARLGIDPWQEAARLNQLSKELATQKLVAMIGDLPGGRWTPSDSRLIAARLVQLLPSRNNSKAPPIAEPRVLPMIRPRAMIWLIYAVVFGTIFMTGHRAPPSGTHHADTPLTNAVAVPPAPLRDSD